MNCASTSIAFTIIALASCLAGEPPIRGRTESRARIALDQGAALFRELANHLESSHVRTAAELPDLAGVENTLKMLSTVTTDIPANDELPAGFIADFEKFKASLPSSIVIEAEDGSPFLLPDSNGTPVRYYFVEEDLALNELELTLFHQQSLELARFAKTDQARREAFQNSFTSADPSLSPLVQAPLRAQTEQNKVVRWVPGSTITYCVLKWTFNSNAARYELVKSNMQKACRDWEGSCNIKFQHVESFDSAPRGTVYPLDGAGKRGVLFVVANYDIGTTIARAFFPNDSINKRLLLVDPDEYFNTTIDKIGVLRHELGHVLGFRHEHISPDAPAWSSSFCSLESSAGSTAVTTYERASVMHYPCTAKLKGGPLSENMKLEITNLDKIGAQAVYGARQAGPG